MASDDIILYNDTTDTITIADIGLEIDPGEGASIDGLPTDELNASDDLQLYVDNDLLEPQVNGEEVDNETFYNIIGKFKLAVSTPNGDFTVETNDVLHFDSSLIVISGDSGTFTLSFEPNLSEKWDFSDGALLLPNGSSNPVNAEQHQIFVNSSENRAYIFDGSNWKDLLEYTNFIDDHENIPTLKHNIAQDHYEEIERNQVNLTTSITAYTDSTKSQKIREIVVQRDSFYRTTSVIYNQYDENGVLIQRETQEIQRDQTGKIISIQSTFEENRNGL